MDGLFSSAPVSSPSATLAIKLFSDGYGGYRYFETVTLSLAKRNRDILPADIETSCAFFDADLNRKNANEINKDTHSCSQNS